MTTELSQLDRLEQIEYAFRRRYRAKKAVNLAISALIVVLGVSSLLFIFAHDREGILTFRWLTVDGTLFTTVISAVYVFVGLVEIIRYTELTRRIVYYARLAAAVAEGIILIVVLISQLPMFEEHMHIFRYDMFNMHLLIPLLMIVSFVTNDSPIGKLSRWQYAQGTWFVTLYAVVILALLHTMVIRETYIPYPFLDFAHMTAMEIVWTVVFLYFLAYTLSKSFADLNRIMSWLWFKGIAGKD